MKYGWITLIMALVFSLIVLTQPVQVDARDDVVLEKLTMKGRSVIEQEDGKPTHLHIFASSIVTPEWSLKVVLTPTEYVSGSLETNVYLFVSGAFELELQNRTLSNGAVSGWLDANRTGVLKLTGEDVTSLEMSFLLSENGSIYAEVSGWFPSAAADQGDLEQATNNHVFWYLSRTTALVAYLLLFINLFLGFGLKVKFLDRVAQRWRTYDLHQLTALIAFTLITLHILTLLGDRYFHFTLVQLLVPFQSPYKNLWVSLGVIGFYLILIVTFSCYLRRRIGQKAWRILHYLSFFLFWAILIHGIKTGTDTPILWVQIMYISSGILIAFLLLWRLFGRASGQTARKVVKTDHSQLTES